MDNRTTNPKTFCQRDASRAIGNNGMNIADIKDLFKVKNYRYTKYLTMRIISPIKENYYRNSKKVVSISTIITLILPIQIGQHRN